MVEGATDTKAGMGLLGVQDHAIQCPSFTQVQIGYVWITFRGFHDYGSCPSYMQLSARSRSTAVMNHHQELNDPSNLYERPFFLILKNPRFPEISGQVLAPINIIVNGNRFYGCSSLLIQLTETDGRN